MRKQSTTVPCELCGVEFPKRSRRIRQRDQLWFCSQECYWTHRRSRPKAPIEPRFWAKVNKNGPVLRPELGPCWVWTGARHYWGYGKISFNGRIRGAHVVAYILTTGHEPPPETPNILHHCDGGNIGCIRPSHIYAGTAQNNTDDMISRGRKIVVPMRGDMNPMRRRPELAARGERNAAAKLTEMLAVKIRERYAVGDVTQHELSAEYDLAQSALSALLRGESWAHAGGPISRVGKGWKPQR